MRACMYLFAFVLCDVVWCELGFVLGIGAHDGGWGTVLADLWVRGAALIRLPRGNQDNGKPA